MSRISAQIELRFADGAPQDAEVEEKVDERNFDALLALLAKQEIHKETVRVVWRVKFF